MAKKKEYPTPKKRFHKDTWELFWNWEGVRYTFYPGIKGEENAGRAEAALRRLSLALASQTPDFPEEWEALPIIRRYIRHRYGVGDDAQANTQPVDFRPVNWLADYEENIRAGCSKDWAAISLSALKRLDVFVPGGVGKVTPSWAAMFLDSLLEKGKAVGTRNRTLAICSRFFNWCVTTKRLRENPFSGVSNLKEPDLEEIVYCTREERDRIIAVARTLGRPDWIAIPVALYAGMRREEIFRVQVEDVNLQTRRLVVRKSKTGRKRTVPIAMELLPILEGHKNAHGPLVTLPDEKTWENHADRLVELVREALCRPAKPDESGRPSEVVGKRTFLYTPAELREVGKQIASLEGSLAKAKGVGKRGEIEEKIKRLQAVPAKAADGGDWIPAERVRWNAWRHTFP